MTDHITLPRSVVEQAIEALDGVHEGEHHGGVREAAETFRAALAGAAQAEPVQLPPWLSYNPEQDVLTINGKRYSPALFAVDGFAAPAGTCLRIVEGPDDVVTCETISAAAPQPAQPVAVPHGYKLVPVEPNDLWAYRVIRNQQPHLDVGCKEWLKCLKEMLHWHTAMLAAAPTPPTATVPVLEPLTLAEIKNIVQEASKGAATRRDGTTSERVVRAVEAAHADKLAKLNGITPPAEGGV